MDDTFHSIVETLTRIEEQNNYIFEQMMLLVETIAKNTTKQ